MQVSVLFRNSKDSSEETGREFIQSMVLSRNSDEEREIGWDRVGDDTSVLKSISQSSISISTSIPVGSHLWSDSLGGSSSRARVPH